MSDLSACKSREEYISLCGPDVTRYGDDRYINLVDYLPLYLKGSDVETFTQFFQDFLNEMFDGVGGSSISSTDLDVTTTYGASGTMSGSYTFDSSAMPTSASEVQEYDISASTVDKISILEKVKRLTELHDPDLIDIEYIQFFAKNLGYNINLTRDQIGVGSDVGNLATLDPTACSATDQSKYLRFMVRNLPNWYKIKSTNNAVKIMLYSFGLIGDIVEYYTNQYNTNGNWVLDYDGSLTDIPNDYFPTPHFAVVVNVDESANISLDAARREKILAAIESIRPINTVFEQLSAYMLRTITLYAGLVTRFNKYIKITSNGYSDYWV